MLAKLRQLKDEREQGFTLIELLVVILIIGILSAIAIPAFLNQRKSAVDSAVQSDVSNAAKMVETWIIKQGSTTKPLPSGATAAAAASSLKDIKASDGTRLSFYGDSSSYCILGTNTGGDVANRSLMSGIPTQGYTYESTKGGQKTGACTDTSYGAVKFAVSGATFADN